MSRRHDSIAVAALALLTLVLFSDVLFGARALATNDLAPFHYPAKKVLREVVRGGELPYWNRAIGAGQPLAANPQHEVFYPPNWLIFLPSFLFGFHALIVLHVAIAMLAMYALLRTMNLTIHAAVFGAISFALGGAVLSTIGLLPFLFSIAWMPLTLACAMRGRWTLGTLSLAMQLLVGEPVMVLQTLILLALYARRKPTIAIVLAAPLVAAVQILPALDHFADSVRSRGFDFRVVAFHSFAPSRLAELFVPGHAQGFLASIYCGLAVTLLAIAGLVLRVRSRELLIAFAGALLIALGDHTPLLRIAYDAHLVRWLRYPEKFMLLAMFALIVFAAITLDALLARFKPGALWLGIGAVLVLADLSRQLPSRVPATYYTTEPAIARTLAPERAQYRILHEADWNDASPEARIYLRPSPALPWVLRNGMFAMIPATYGFRTAVDIDYDLTFLEPTDDFGRAAFALARIRADWGSIIAPMANVWYRAVYRPVGDRQSCLSRTGEIACPPPLLEPVVMVPLPHYPRYSFARKLVTIRSHAEFVRALASKPDPGTAFIAERSFTPANARVKRVRESANDATIEVESDGDAFLVMSVTPHKYWTITIDGAEARAVIVNAGFQGVAVPRGAHVVEMRYRNPLIAAGAAVSLAALLGLAFATMRAL